MFDHKLYYFCTTDKQREALDAWLEHGTGARAAKALKIHIRKFEERIKRIKDEAFRKGYAPTNTKTRQAADTLQKRYIVTSALNDCPLHKPFFNNLVAYAKAIDAELLVIPVKYKNPNAFNNKDDKEATWPAEMQPYMVFKSKRLAKGLKLCADVPISGTAAIPLTGLDTITGGDSGIFGHAQVQLSCIPTPHKKLPKVLTTCGSISKPVYSNSKAGVKAKHHHSLAAVVVEATKKGFHLRHVQGESNGRFYDLDKCVHGEKVTNGHRAESVTLGDEHVIFADPDVVKATFYGDDSICAVLRPKNLVRHDVLDMYSGSHHHRGNYVTNYAKHHSGVNNVKQELDITIDHLARTLPKDCNQYIVGSNHHDHLDRWLSEAAPDNDPENALLFHTLRTEILKSTRMTPYGSSAINPFEWYSRGKLKRTKFLGRMESLVFKGIEHSMHGDVGPNGARGSARNLSRIGIKSNIGHSHTPCIFQGVFQSGLAAFLNLEYSVGPSSWLHTHTVVYANGKRTLINIIDGRWRG